MKHSPGFVALVEAARAHVSECSIDEMLALRDHGTEFFLIDVREDDEWREGHIPGASHLGKGIIERDVETAVPDKTAAIILYCGGGYRSVLAADALQKMGYSNVKSMAGGWRAWQERSWVGKTP